MFDIKKVIDELLDEAETLLEAYLTDKLAFLEKLEVKGHPRGEY
ncbi:hypothetical protein [Paenibacillus polymyxa]|nr:hypothetical protein [Paenibacillus polymyxa]